jgi:Protein of unknown function (DUF1592)/Protein of unknown function (DUF1588)/Protein of unknown function (DUF1587)/Protein of unknown function (DUF1585)/Protein of unknown function (DUF1595)
VGIISRARTPRGGLWRGGLVLGLLAVACRASSGADGPGAGLRPVLREYCLDCHGGGQAEAGVDLGAMTNAPDFGRRFKDWEKVARVLRERKMPPEDEPQPSGPQREEVVRGVEAGLRRFIEEHQGDPGQVPIRRLTSAEYAYTLRDLTGLDLRVADDFVSDAVSGEGFTNAGGAQFLQDSTLERYLQAAKAVADHAVIGAGPLGFFADPGKTGRELSAIARIQAIYREHGFRTAAGEGAEAFGLDLYPRAMLVAWRIRHRDRLGLGAATLPDLARAEGVSARLCEHLWDVLNRADAPFPLSAIIEGWRSLPPPGVIAPAEVRGRCDELGRVLRGWQKTLAASAGDEEEAAVLTAGEVRVATEHSLTADLSWPEGAKVAGFELSVARASKDPADAAVVWKNPKVRFRRVDRRREPFRPLGPALAPETAARLALGRHPRGGAIGGGDFATTGEVKVPVVLRVPEGMMAAQLVVDVELDVRRGGPGIVRCRIADGEAEGETAAEVGDTSTLLADPADPRVAEWRAGVEEFARLVPEVSHREPAPSDRDPIPAPFDNAYNKPERNHFHSAIKYHRDDAFFAEHVADDETRRRLDQAWADLLTAFDYHDANLRFMSEKFGLGLKARSIAEFDREAIDRLPAEPRALVRRLRDEHDAMHQALRDAEPGHVEDALRFSERAWRRPLASDEATRLRGFYVGLRREGGLDHERAIRALLARILVAPGFLFRAEPPAGGAGIVPLTDWQLANRLSYFLWSSMPDEPLRGAAAAGRLRDPAELELQARRMLRDPKARRLATEFFGQWLGFYRFDRFQGIDTGRFPEFTDRLRAAMYEEAVSFFEYLVREDRPVDEVVFADYTFLNRPLAEHYGVPAGAAKGDAFVKVEGLAGCHRGGLLGMGAVLATTSAPRRTSAVKRGDWVLRRVVGTPVPPPPADVGSIPADEVLSDGLTVRERLEAHRTNRSCANCHARIDPLGFALEPFDPLGRWRDAYGDGRPIDPSGTLRDGSAVSGPEGLRDYLRREEAKFHRTVGVKLLGYALGRPEMVSDRPLIERMTDGLARGGRVSDLVVRIVTSEQFRNQRSQ